MGRCRIEPFANVAGGSFFVVYYVWVMGIFSKPPWEKGGVFNPHGKGPIPNFKPPDIPDPGDIADKIKREVLEEVPHMIEKTVTKQFPKLLEEGAEDLVRVLRNYAKDNIIKEVEQFGKNKMFSVARVVTESGQKINSLVPTTGFSVSASIAGNGVTVSWDGQEQVSSVLDEIRSSLDDNRISTGELKKIMEKAAPSSVDFQCGGTLTLALVAGTEIDIGMQTSYRGKDIPKLITHFDDVAEEVFYKMPKRVIGELI